jgi:hypothetical protein
MKILFNFIGPFIVSMHWQLGGYHAATDSVRILDVARFKYPPHWVPLPVLYDSMRNHIDTTNNQCRGYMRIAAKHHVSYYVRRRFMD